MRKNKHLYTANEVAEISRAYAGLAYAKVAVDSMDLKNDPKKNAAVLRGILENTIPTFYEAVPTVVRRKLDNQEVIAFSRRCETLLEKLAKGDR